MCCCWRTCVSTPAKRRNDPEFAKALAKLGDVYVNDAFATAHRAHASTATIAKSLPAYAGRLMQAELEALGKALDHPARPVVAIVGGAKVSTKLDLLGNLVGRVDTLVIGGGMANTFLFAQGIGVGESLCEKEMADTARAILEKAKNIGQAHPAAGGCGRRRQARSRRGHQDRSRLRRAHRPDDPRCRPGQHQGDRCRP